MSALTAIFIITALTAPWNPTTAAAHTIPPLHIKAWSDDPIHHENAYISIHENLCYVPNPEDALSSESSGADTCFFYVYNA